MFKNWFFRLFLALAMLAPSLVLLTSPVKAEGVQPTPKMTILYGSVSLKNGIPAPVGTLVQFFTTRGELAGEWTIQDAGILALTHVYGNDGLGTPGFLLNEPISVRVNGQDFNIWPNIDWQNDLDEHQVQISPITETINVFITGGPQFLNITTDGKILVHGTSCNGARPIEILPGTTKIDTGASRVVCPGFIWEFFQFITLEQGQAVVVTTNNLIGWGQGASPYLWIFERKAFYSNHLPAISR